MSARAIIATIGYKIKENLEAEAYRKYTARCLRILTVNTFAIACGGSEEVSVSCLPVDYEDIINPKPKKEQKPGQATENIRAKMR